MLKGVLTHEVVPGKFAALRKWFSDADAQRKQSNPDYVAPRRYVTVVGNLTRVYVESSWEDGQSIPTWLERGEPGLLECIVPGSTEFTLLREI